jgi:protein-tyrosine phosphatase
VPYRVCFVCLGNICRSPMADAVMRAMVREAGLEIESCSAGTGVWHIGEAADHRALDALGRRGYDASSHRARQFSASWFADHDLVLALDRSNLAALHGIAPSEQQSKVRLLREFDPQAGADLDAGPGGGLDAGLDAGLDVPDPFYGGPRGFEDVLDIVERSCRNLLAQLRSDG